MNGALKAFCYMSLSGSMLIAVLLLSKPILKNRVSKQWQYYIWIIVIARLLLPFTPPKSFTETIFKQSEQENMQLFPVQEYSETANPALDRKDSSAPVNDETHKENGSMTPAKLMINIGETMVSYLWLAWLGVAALLLVRKITIYQSFLAYLKAGLEEVADIELLNRLSLISADMRIKRTVELYENRMASSPMLIGFFHPCIILPNACLSENDFSYTVRHELFHYKRMDLIYKWVVQFTICLHWFNPIVWLMGRELNRVCELSCDEAVIQKLDAQKRRDYGDTLLHAMTCGINNKNVPSSVMLSENAKLLKERLDAIMKYKKSSKLVVTLSAVLTAVMLTGATAAGAVIPSKSSDRSEIAETEPILGSADSKINALIKKYDKDGDILLLKLEFMELEENAKKTCLNKIYKNGEIALFSNCLNQLNQDSPLLVYFAKKAYKDQNISFFSVVANLMDKNALEIWLEKAKEDGKMSFQSVLLNSLDRDWELEKLEEKLEKERIAEYKKYGITKDGKSYYYKGKLVNIFMDVRKNSSFYVLDMNPKGTVNIKVKRNAKNKIKKVKRMSESEAAELFGDMKD